MFKYNLIFLFFFFQFGNIIAQTDFNYTLISEDVTFLGESTPINSTIKKVDETLIWTQERKGKVKELIFRIHKIKGGWDVVDSTGYLTYTLKHKDYNGFNILFNLKGTDGKNIAVLSIRKNGNGKKDKNELYEFKILEINYQP